MDHIETKILNSYTIQEAAQNMVFAARLALFIETIDGIAYFAIAVRGFFQF